ncbi:MAG: radical SAM protein [Candidatus Helarchaeota archaeon]
MVKYILKQYKTILNKLKYIDSWFWCRYTLNPYVGCYHACIYCDARSKKYYLHPDFEKTIYVKKNAPIMLDKRLSRARTLLSDVVAIGGVTDSYQPAEKKFKNTRNILKVLSKHKFPVILSTKSDLVLRDLDIFSNIAETTWCTIGFTITTFNEDLVKFLEPRASPPEKRLEAITQIKKEYPKIQVGTNFIPIIPLLEDSPENMEEIVRRTKEAGADFILFGAGMTLRDAQAKFFLEKLQQAFPNLLEEFKSLYRTGTQAWPSWTSRINKHVFQLCKKYNIGFRLKRFIPHDFRKENYKIAQHLLNKAYINQILGKSWKKMHWAGMNIQNLKESIIVIAARNGLKAIKNVTDDIITEIKPFLKTRDLTQFLT